MGEEIKYGGFMKTETETETEIRVIYRICIDFASKEEAEAFREKEEYHGPIEIINEGGEVVGLF